ncbi:hypothetical protein [Mycobacterium sp.]|uniref:hypothetical protein n=1 Tax=Mycobacterium sp. TaxID=1785 RepID=UPI002DB1B026|nr:hypothetical protein [Mycobacterium sp.]
MQFLAPARATDLIAIGRVLRRGKTLVNCDVDVITKPWRRRSPPTRSVDLQLVSGRPAGSSDGPIANFDPGVRPLPHPIRSR